MDTTTKLKPQTIAELLPSLGGILSKDTIQMLTSRKQPRQTMAQTSTSEKVYKPLTIAEMKADILALRVKSPRIAAGRHAATSARKKNWNSSVKVEKKVISHTANGQMTHNPVRKVLNFQPKPKTIPNPRATMNMVTPKFPKSEVRTKKSFHPQVNNVRISGICHIPETPIITNNQIKSRMTINANPINKKIITPRLVIQKKLLAPPVPDTPLSNVSWKSSCDESFLQKEKEINDIENKVLALEEQSLENIAEVSPPVSTPFKDYRNVTEFFNNTSNMETSTELNDDTIMCFDKPTICKENSKREESVIVSLCDLLKKATVNPSKSTTEIDELLEVEKQTINNLQLIENIKQGQLRTLQYVRKLIHEKRQQTTSSTDMDKTLVDNTKDTPKVHKKDKLSPVKSPIVSIVQSSSVIKKSPSYKIPKKNLCLRKKVFHKSMPAVSSEMLSPSRDMGSRARSMYMKMKEHMNFLNTPVVKQKSLDVPDTPAVTSHNLQKQLDKLYGRS